MYAIDFETYYDSKYTVKNNTYSRYAEDPRFDAYLVAIEGNGVSFCGDPTLFDWSQIDSEVWISHNVAFDQACYMRLGLRAAPSQWHCTMDMCRYLNGPASLKDAAREYLGVRVDKEIRDELKGVKFRKLTAQEQKPIVKYAIKDAKLCLRLWKKLNKQWPDHERELSRQTREISRRGVRVSRAKLLKMKSALEKERDKALDAIPWYHNEGGKVFSIPELNSWLKLNGMCPMPTTNKKDPKTYEYLEHYPKAREMLERIWNLRGWNKTIKSLDTLMERIRKDGTVELQLQYFGADLTGRWSGRGGFNIQNVNKSTGIRSVFIPKTNHRFVIADLSQIEPRCLAYLAEDREFLNLIARGVDVYEAHARATMGYSDPKPLRKADPEMRQFAKARVLGLGYGAGSKRFQEMAKSLYGIDLTDEAAKRAVNHFRTSNPKIVTLWRTMGYRLDEKTTRGGDETLELKLPTGRKLRYYHVQGEGNDHFEEEVSQISASRFKGGRRDIFYGAKIVENMTQGMARDVFGFQLCALEEAGFDIKFHVHDEVIVEVPKAQAKDAKEQILNILKTPLKGLEDLPLDAEATIDTYYSK